MSDWSYDYTWPTDENMKKSKTFAAGIFRTRRDVRESLVWVSGPVASQVRVRKTVNRIINEYKLGKYKGGKVVYIDLNQAYQPVR